MKSNTHNDVDTKYTTESFINSSLRQDDFPQASESGSNAVRGINSRQGRRIPMKNRMPPAYQRAATDLKRHRGQTLPETEEEYISIERHGESLVRDS